MDMSVQMSLCFVSLGACRPAAVADVLTEDDNSEKAQLLQPSTSSNLEVSSKSKVVQRKLMPEITKTSFLILRQIFLAFEMKLP